MDLDSICALDTQSRDKWLEEEIRDRGMKECQMTSLELLLLKQALTAREHKLKISSQESHV
jgi:hypothetical protein